MGWEVHGIAVVVLFPPQRHQYSSRQRPVQPGHMTGYQEKMSPKWEAGGKLPSQVAGRDQQPETSNQEQPLSSGVSLISISFIWKIMKCLTSQFCLNLIETLNAWCIKIWSNKETLRLRVVRKCHSLLHSEKAVHFHRNGALALAYLCLSSPFFIL